MSVQIIEERLSDHHAKNETEEVQILREITQEIILASLGRSDFFSHASFQGGTCLRIFYGLNRFSEDLDFTLLRPSTSFNWRKYLDLVILDLAHYGYEMEITDRSRVEGAVKLAFLKDDAIGKLLNLQFAGKHGPLAKIKIKLEIDTNPPEGSLEERRTLDFPFLSRVTVQDLPTLFAGKLHALLCRPYIKGRDWYDYLWYTSKKTKINYTYLDAALKQFGPYKNHQEIIDRSWVIDALKKRIASLDFSRATEDVRRFIPSIEQQSLDFWDTEVFLEQTEKIP